MSALSLELTISNWRLGREVEGLRHWESDKMPSSSFLLNKGVDYFLDKTALKETASFELNEWFCALKHWGKFLIWLAINPVRFICKGNLCLLILQLCKKNILQKFQFLKRSSVHILFILVLRWCKYSSLHINTHKICCTGWEFQRTLSIKIIVLSH